ncbi:Lsr2 family protein [uncultured Friedmanniella sp.]|uniref:histone-like nucleoid-structuring protein Lsr2 n=1 Tax=uncultured Friedmanniella sp. TaxID=335381 RepID=UPI0035CBE26D
MAQKTIVKTYDDLDGSEIDAEGKSVSFSLEGATYEIDLSSKNVEKLREDLRVYTEKARRVTGRGTRGGKAEPAPVDTRAVRAWAEEKGLGVSSRGRLSTELIEQYRAAH